MDKLKFKSLPFIILLTLGALLRIFYLLEYQHLPFFTHFRLDGALYHDLGLKIAAGDWSMGSSVYLMSPLYSYFIGSIYTFFGSGPWGVRIIQIVLGLLTTVFIYRSAEILWGRRSAILAGALSTFYLPFVFYEMQYSVASLGAFLFAALIYSCIKIWQSPARKPKLWLLVGLIFGLNTIARPNTLILLLPLFVLIFSLNHRAKIKALLFFLIGAILMIAPVTIRNYIVAHDFVLITSSGGMNFFLGNGPKATGTFHVPDFLPEAVHADAQFRNFKAYAEQEVGHPLAESEVDKFWRKEAIDHIKGDPLHWLNLLRYKFALFWNAREIENSDNFAFHQELSNTLSLPLVEFRWIAIFALLGCLLLWLGTNPIERLLALSSICFCAANVLIFILSHYRLPGVPLLILTAVGSLTKLKTYVTEKQTKPLLLASAMTIAISFMVNASMIHDTFDEEYFKLGYAATTQYKLPLAEWAYNHAIELNPDHLSAHKNLAVHYALIGQKDPSIKHWKEVIRIATKEKNDKELKKAIEQLNLLISR